MLGICKIAFIALAIATYSSPAFAHPGHGIHHSLMQGFLHPPSGLDHVLAMVCVGFLAFCLGGPVRWVIPGRPPRARCGHRWQASRLLCKPWTGREYAACRRFGRSNLNAASRETS
jgi:hypothetical protein